MIFYFHPYLGKWSNFTNSNGLKPPTSVPFFFLGNWIAGFGVHFPGNFFLGDLQVPGGTLSWVRKGWSLVGKIGRTWTWPCLKKSQNPIDSSISIAFWDSCVWDCHFFCMHKIPGIHWQKGVMLPWEQQRPTAEMFAHWGPAKTTGPAPSAEPRKRFGGAKSPKKCGEMRVLGARFVDGGHPPASKLAWLAGKSPLQNIEDTSFMVVFPSQSC